MDQMSRMYARVLAKFSRQLVVACFSLPQFVHIIKRTLHVGLKI